MPSESQRLSILRQSCLLDTPPEPFFESLVEGVRTSLHVPISVISLVDECRQWFKARRGLAASETTRDIAFCAEAIKTPEPFLVPDATADRRFANNPLVTGNPYIRAYLGIPIEYAGARIGTVAVIDTEPHNWTSKEVDHIHCYAMMLQEYLKAREALYYKSYAERVESKLSETRLLYETVFTQMLEGVVVQDESGEIVTCNDAAATILGLTQDQLMGRDSMDPRWHATDVDGLAIAGDEHPAMVALATGMPVRDYIMSVSRPDQGRRWLRVNARPVGRRDEGNYRAITTFADVTEIHAAVPPHLRAVS